MSPTTPPPVDPAGTDAIAAALVSFQAAMPVVPKAKTAHVTHKGGGSHSYSYADLADIVEAATPILTAHGLAFTCQPREGAGRGYELAATLLHTSGQTITGALPLHGNTPQELGSSITYARRYLLGCLTGIVTDTDDDAQASKGATRTRSWSGPSTRALIEQIEADAASIGVDAERATAKLRRDTGTDVESMFALDPWVVQPFADQARAFTEKTKADAAAPVTGDDAAEASARADLNL